MQEDMPTLTVKAGTETYITTNYGWDGPDFCFETADGSTVRLGNAYIKGFHMEGIDYDSDDQPLTIELTQRYA